MLKFIDVLIVISITIILLRAKCTNAQDERPNFIFYYPDTLRAESFNAYGNKVPDVSPNFDAFAKSGTLFEQCHVPHTQCTPSRTAMLTGRFMHVAGHRTQTHLIRSYEENYFRLLKENGYTIHWYGKNDALSHASFNKSVTHWSGHIGYDKGNNAFPYGISGYWSMLSDGGSTYGNNSHNGDYKAVKKAVDWLNDKPPEPFAIFIATSGAHPSYGAPLEYQSKWTTEQIKENVELRTPNIKNKPKYHSYDEGIPFYRNLTGMNEDDFYEIQKVYLQMISYTDWLFGVLLDGLKESGFDNNTAVFFSSDHGDFAGDYHMVEKWPGGADDVLTRVPLAARIPKGLQNRVVKGPVQTFDIMETFLDLAGIKNDFVRFAKSLKEHMTNPDYDDLERTVYSEGGFYFHSELFPGGSDHVPDNPHKMYWPRAQEEMSNNGTGSPKFVMLRNLNSKLVYRPDGVSELYDLALDPRELTNVYEDEIFSDLRKELEKEMIAWLIRTGDAPPLRTDDRGMPHCPIPITEETCQALLEPDPSNDPFERDLYYKDELMINGIESFEYKEQETPIVEIIN